MEPITLPQAEIQIVVDHIVKAFSPCTVFVFGYRNNTNSASTLLCIPAQNVTMSHHFDLLVFSNKAFQNGGSSIASTLAENFNRTITTSVLLHKVTDLATKQASQQWFFDTMLRKGQRLAFDKANVPYILNHKPERDLESDSRFWQKCVAVAQFNIQGAKDSPQVDVGLCKIALLNSACVQIALGLIRVFLGYTPNEFGLKFLLQLCQHFTDLPEKMFAQNTENGIRLYKMLCAPANMLFHWTRIYATEEDFTVLLDGSLRFLDGAEVLAATELERLPTN